MLLKFLQGSLIFFCYRKMERCVACCARNIVELTFADFTKKRKIANVLESNGLSLFLANKEIVEL